MSREFWVGQRLNCDITDPEKEAIVTAVGLDWVEMEMEIFGERTLVRMDRSKFDGMPPSPFWDNHDDGADGSAICS